MTPEDRLTALMEAAVADLAPPVRDILAGAELRGRRLRRRRRIVLAVASAGAVLVTGTGVDVGLRLTASDQIGVAGYRETATATPSATASATPSATPSATAFTSLVPINAAAELAILRKLLSPWSITKPAAKGSGRAGLWVTGNDGKGEFTLFVGVASTADSGMDPADCAQQGLLTKSAVNAAGAAQPGCTQLRTDTGDTITQEVVGAVHSGGYYLYRVIAHRADGVAVEIEVSDGIAATGAVTRATPPLDPGLWSAIVTDPAWRLEVPAAEAR